MIEIKDAVENAINFLNEIKRTELPNLKVEEIDLEEDNYTIITLGWDEERPLTPLEKLTKPANVPALRNVFIDHFILTMIMAKSKK